MDINSPQQCGVIDSPIGKSMGKSKEKNGKRKDFHFFEKSGMSWKLMEKWCKLVLGRTCGEPVVFPLVYGKCHINFVYPDWSIPVLDWDGGSFDAFGGKPPRMKIIGVDRWKTWESVGWNLFKYVWGKECSRFIQQNWDLTIESPGSTRRWQKFQR